METGKDARVVAQATELSLFISRRFINQSYLSLFT